MIPRLRIPIQLSGSRLSTVESDSAQEVSQCVYSILSTEIGSRVELPDFGLEPQLFLMGGVDDDEIRSAIEDWEPRVTELFTETEWEQLVQKVRVQIGV